MGLRPLGEKWVRRLRRITGEDIVWAVGNGGYVFGFTTADHRHGWYDKKTDEWGWEEGRIMHATSCSRLFPGWDGS